MNYRNKFNLLLTIIVTVLTIIGCSNDKETLSVSPNTLDKVSGDGGVIRFGVRTNQPGLVVTQTAGTEEWAHLSGFGMEYKLIVDPNISYTDERNTTVTFTVPGAAPVIIGIAQASAVKEDGKYFEITSAAFDKSNVIKIMDGEKQLGELCKEYLYGEDIDAQAIVVYPVKNGKADMTKGFVAQVLQLTGEAPDFQMEIHPSAIHGGTVSFDDKNAISSYKAGTQPALQYITINKQGTILGVPKETAEQLNMATLVNDVLADGDQNEYGLVKIASQYWMRSNLRTTKLNNGTQIKEVTTTGSGSWETPRKNGEPLFCKSPVSGDASVLGYLYSVNAIGYSLTGEYSSILAPAGSHIPTTAEYEMLLTYLGMEDPTATADNVDIAAKVKIAGSDYWTSYSSGGGVVPNQGNNLTGLGLPGAGYRDGDSYDGASWVTFMFASDGKFVGEVVTDRFNLGNANVRIAKESGTKFGVSVRSIKN